MFLQNPHITQPQGIFSFLCVIPKLSAWNYVIQKPIFPGNKGDQWHKRVHTVWSCLCKSQNQAKAIRGAGSGDESPSQGMWEVRTGRIMRVLLECWWWSAYWSGFLVYEGISVCENSSSCIIMYITHQWRFKMKKPGYSETGWLASAAVSLKKMVF